MVAVNQGSSSRCFKGNFACGMPFLAKAQLSPWQQLDEEHHASRMHYTNRDAENAARAEDDMDRMWEQPHPPGLPRILEETCLVPRHLTAGPESNSRVPQNSGMHSIITPLQSDFYRPQILLWWQGIMIRELGCQKWPQAWTWLALKLTNLGCRTSLINAHEAWEGPAILKFISSIYLLN